jgi:HEPN domain-containing protein
LLIRLEEAHVSSKYIPGEYEREEAEELIAFVEEAVKFIENLRGKAKT